MVKGFGVLVQVKGEGTLMWKIEDDDGVIHPINIKKALYVPESPSCLLYPQNGHSRQTSITLSQTVHGAPLSPVTARCTGTRNATAVPYPGILQPMWL